MCIDLLPEKFLQAIKKSLQKVTLVSQLRLSNAKISKSYIPISACELFRI